MSDPSNSPRLVSDDEKNVVKNDTAKIASDDYAHDVSLDLGTTADVLGQENFDNVRPTTWFQSSWV